MKITNIKIGEVNSPLKKPFVTALRTATHCRDFVVIIETDHKHTGYGSVAPTPAITGETQESILNAFNAMAQALIGKELSILVHDLKFLKESINFGTNSGINAKLNFNKNRGAYGAFDIALHDIYAQNEGKPLFSYLGGSQKTLTSDLTISLNNDINKALEDCKDALNQGFKILKIKIGHGPKQDLELIKKILALNSSLLLRIDANQAYTRDDALTLLEHCRNLERIEFIEQPVKAHDIDSMALLVETKSSPILADESVFDLEDAQKVIQKKACHFINIKLAKCGGLAAAFEIAQLGHSAQTPCYIGCMLEGAIAVSAATHFACAHPNIKGVDLDPPFLVAHDNIKSSLRLDAGTLMPHDNVLGLGILGINNFQLINEYNYA